MHFQNRRLDPLLLQFFHRFQHPAQDEPAAHQRDIRAVLDQRAGLAQLKRNFLVENHMFAAVRDPQESRPVIFGDGQRRRKHLGRIRWNDDRHVGDTAQNAQILEELMRDAFALAAENAAVRADQFDVDLGIGHEGTDLFAGPHGDKAGIRRHKGNQAASGHAGGAGHGVLLSDPQFDQAIRIFFGEPDHAHGFHRVRGNDHIAAVLRRQLHHRGSERFAGTRIVTHRQSLPAIPWLPAIRHPSALFYARHCPFPYRESPCP